MSADNGHRTRTFTWQDPMQSAMLARERSGMEVLQAIMEGTVGPPPIADLLGMSLVEVTEGRAVFAVEPAEWMYNPIGSVHGGITVDSGRVLAAGTVVHAGRRLATAEGRLTEEATGKLLAHATTGCTLIS
jgi:acyl-coenzyme A thioesterase PaaI-like protein